jgi:hypothetical protein
VGSQGRALRGPRPWPQSGHPTYFQLLQFQLGKGSSPFL